MRLLLDSEVAEVVAIRKGPVKDAPPLATGEPLPTPNDHEGRFVGQFTMEDGLVVPFFPPTDHDDGEERRDSCGVDVWTAGYQISWDWAPPRILQREGNRFVEIDPGYAPLEYPDGGYLATSSRSMIRALEGSEDPLFISGHDMRQALEVAIAVSLSAEGGGVPVSLPLPDRESALYPGGYRWAGGDVTGRSQTVEEIALGKL